MTTTQKPVTKLQLDMLRKSFAEMPRKEQTVFTAREAVLALADDISRMVTEDGYSFEDIADLLRRSDIVLKPGTIRNYLRDITSKAATTPRKARPVQKMGVAKTAEVPLTRDDVRPADIARPHQATHEVRGG